MSVYYRRYECGGSGYIITVKSRSVIKFKVRCTIID